MTYKSIMVHVEGTTRCRSRIELARALAERFDAHLTGIYTIGPTEIPGYLRAELGEGFMQHRADLIAERRRTMHSRFLQDASGMRPSRLDFQAVEGDPTQALAMLARMADLVVIGQTELPLADGSVVNAAFPENLVLASRRPCLVIPYAGEFKPRFEHPMIAWKATGEAVRAVTDALPILQQAKRVTVVCVEPSSEPRPAFVPDIALFLARHDVPVEVVFEQGGNPDVASALLNRAFNIQADLLVMGCYGHSRLRELILGGVSRTIFQTMTVPVLFAH